MECITNISHLKKKTYENLTPNINFSSIFNYNQLLFTTCFYTLRIYQYIED
jgi:hypothetical protein